MLDTIKNAFKYFQSNFHGEELALYNQHLSVLQKLYAELLSASSKRMSDLETLQDFLQSATNQLVWLNEKEEIEVSRDWTEKDLNIPALEHHYEVCMRYVTLYRKKGFSFIWQ